MDNLCLRIVNSKLFGTIFILYMLADVARNICIGACKHIIICVLSVFLIGEK